MKVLGITSYLFLAFLFYTTADCQNGEKKKDWTFHSSHGALTISASSFPNESGPRLTRLTLSPAVYGSWTVAEEAGALASVLDALDGAGFDSRRLSSIGLRLEEKDAVKVIATRAALSHSWLAALRTRSASKTNPLVVDLINQSQAYKEWSRVFNQRGFELKAVWVEELGLEPFSKSGMTCPLGVDCANLLVPSGAFVQMNIIPLSHD